MIHWAAAPLLLLLLLLVPVPVQAQGAVLDVRAEVSPSMARMRVLEYTEPLVSVLAGVPSRPYPCRLVLRDGVLCRVTGFPQDAEDLQLVIDAPGFQRTLRTATRIDAVRNRRAVSLGPIHLRPAAVTAGPIAISHGDSTLRLQLAVTSRDERVEVRSITLEATKPGGLCITADPRVTYRLSSDLVVRENGDRWLVTSTATDSGIEAEYLRVEGEFVRGPCGREWLFLRLAPRISVAREGRLEIDLVLPRHFRVRNAETGSGRFTAPVEAFRVFVVSLHTTSRDAPRVRAFVQP